MGTDSPVTPSTPVLPRYSVRSTEYSVNGIREYESPVVRLSASCYEPRLFCQVPDQSVDDRVISLQEIIYCHWLPIFTPLR